MKPTLTPPSVAVLAEGEPVWTDKHQRRALKQGWSVFNNGTYGLGIERYDVADRFDSDNAALLYVMNRAINGDPVAIAALRYIDAYHGKKSNQ